MEQYSTIKEVASKYQVTEKTVRNWVKSGLPHIKIGNVLRFNMLSVDKFIKGEK